ncbi:hypothetical protein MMC17_002993 [Xylographa soralifera]|nr:hypothetical protein [Xylographa soralifera]
MSCPTIRGPGHPDAFKAAQTCTFPKNSQVYTESPSSEDSLSTSNHQVVKCLLARLVHYLSGAFTMGLWTIKRRKASEGEVTTSTRSCSSGIGLKVLYKADDAKVDIIFVHGLTGHREETWTAKGVKDSWPQTLLPQIISQSRILTFGYDAKVADWVSEVSKNRLGNHAEGLLEAVASYREGDNTNDRYIFFVTHSLGGLVCEDTLNLSRTSADLYQKKILECTWGIAFLGTPHLGSDIAAWAEPVAKIIGTFKSTNSDILEPLNAGSYTLERIEGDFQKMIRARRGEKKRELRIASFYEELPVGKLGLIVPRRSAKLDAYTNVSIHANHMEMTKFDSLEDPGFRLVAGQLQRWVNEFGTIEGDTSTIPYSQNPFFVGRQDIFQKIDEIFKLELNRQLAIYGLGGVGKTEILLQYAYRYRQRAQIRPVFWVSAISSSRFRDTYRGIAEKLKLVNGDKDREMDVLQLVKTALEKKGSGEWLMIIDNAEETNILFDKPSDVERNLFNYIPESPSGHVIISTRSRFDAEKLARKTLWIGELSHAESKQLLRDIVSDVGVVDAANDEWAELLDELGHLPLAIVQAANYMKNKGWSVARYLELYREDLRLEMLSHEVPVLGSEEHALQSDPSDQRAKNTVLRTFITTFRQIREQDSRAADILSLMACYHWENIPYDLIRDVNSKSWLVDRSKAKVPGSFAASIRTLTAFSFITATVDDRSYTMHRVVRQSLLTWLASQGQKAQWIETALFTVIDQYSVECFEDRAKLARLTPHVMPVLELYPKRKINSFDADIDVVEFTSGWWEEFDWYHIEADCVLPVCKVLCRCAEYLLDEGQYNRAESYGVLACNMLTSRPSIISSFEPPESSKTQRFGHTVLHEKFQIYVKSVLVQISLAMGNTLKTIALARLTCNEYTRLIKYWSVESNIEKYESYDTPEFIKGIPFSSPDPFEGLEHMPLEEQLPLVDLINLNISAEISRGQYRSAEFNINFIIQWARRHSIALPFAVATNIALIRRNQGKYAEAECAFRDLLARATLESGLNSLESLQIKTYLATTQFSLRNWDAGQILNEEVLEIRNAMLTEMHPRIFENKNLAALMLYGQGNFSAAEKCLHALFGLARTNFGLQNPVTLVIANNLAVVLYSLGKRAAAEEYCKIAFQGFTEIEEPLHICRTTARDNLYKILYSQGKTGYEWIKDVGIEEPPMTNYRDWLNNIHNYRQIVRAAPWIAKEYDTETFQRVLESYRWYQILKKRYVEILTDRQLMAAPKRDIWKSTTKLLKPWKSMNTVFLEEAGGPGIPPNAGTTRVIPDPAEVTMEVLIPLGMNRVNDINHQNPKK